MVARHPLMQKSATIGDYMQTSQNDSANRL